MDPYFSKYIGKTYGGLTILDIVEERTPSVNTRVSCACIHCGKIVTRTLTGLRNNPESCGCLKKKKVCDGSRTITKICPTCGKEFQSFQSQNKKYCCIACRPKSGKKTWRFQSPDGQIYECENLRKWATDNVQLIDPGTQNPKLSVERFCCGMYTVRRTIECPDAKTRTKALRYKGWTCVENVHMVKRDPHLRLCICETCGNEFRSKGRARYCPFCKIERQKEREKDYYRRRKEEELKKRKE